MKRLLLLLLQSVNVLQFCFLWFCVCESRYVAACCGCLSQERCGGDGGIDGGHGGRCDESEEDNHRRTGNTFVGAGAPNVWVNDAYADAQAVFIRRRVLWLSRRDVVEGLLDCGVVVFSCTVI